MALEIRFQNENLIAFQTNTETQEKSVLAVVPDLICIVDMETYEPVLTEDLKFGLRVCILTLPCDPLLTTPEALKVCGPKAFHYEDVEYQPLEGRKEVKSIVDS
jgi:uncharacterized protein